MDVPVLPKPIETAAAKAPAAAPASPAAGVPARPAAVAPAAPVPVPSIPGALAVPTAVAPVATAAIITAMLKAATGTSDLFFSPFRAPQVEVNGQLLQLKIAGVG